MPIRIPELAFNHRRALEVVADREFVGHAHAAVDLDGFLSAQRQPLADLRLRH